MQRTKQNHAWRVFRLLLIFFCIGLSLQFTSCGKKQAENTVFSVDDLSGKKNRCPAWYNRRYARIRL